MNINNRLLNSVITNDLVDEPLDVSTLDEGQLNPLIDAGFVTDDEGGKIRGTESGVQYLIEKDIWGLAPIWLWALKKDLE